jgi:hypothetical protein
MPPMMLSSPSAMLLLAPSIVAVKVTMHTCPLVWLVFSLLCGQKSSALTVG